MRLKTQLASVWPGWAFSGHKVRYCQLDLAALARLKRPCALSSEQYISLRHYFGSLAELWAVKTAGVRLGKQGSRQSDGSPHIATYKMVYAALMLPLTEAVQPRYSGIS